MSLVSWPLVSGLLSAATLAVAAKQRHLSPHRVWSCAWFLMEATVLWW